ncbi:hypothetical protein BC941DRAFT_19215 [Chlamydoabsidia padenii]|nr:hypothetical protein BC941DRAFT_19215 [Chlamydoabsidia padenii]
MGYYCFVIDREVERLNRKKRASSEIARMHHIELEQLIGVLDNNNKDEDADITDTDNYTNQDAYDSPPLIKQEPQDHNDISTNDERPKVMSIDFLCSGNDNQQSSFSHSPLDLLCNAVLDAEYLNVRPKQEDITVVVSPNIHRDATDRVMRNHYDQQQQQQQWRDDEDSTSDTKADSAVGLSPDQDIYQLKPTPPPSTNTIEKITDSNIATTPTKKETSSSSTNTKTAQWQDPLFDDEPLSDLDDFMDDVSDLSSICSSDSDLESISSNENLGHLSTPSPSPVSTNKKEPTNKQKQPDNSKSKSDLDCVACGRTLNSETISDPSAVDLAVANELATWTWSPSAAFTDWRPQRCPRCERHVRVFNQEWPSRKIKKRPTSSNDSTKPTSTTSTTTTSVNRRSNTKKKSTLSNQYITKPTRKQYIRSPPTPTSEIFNGVEDLF